jgi:hypothetical protein
VSVWIATCTSNDPLRVRQQSIAAGVDPQSSCSFNPIAPAADLLARPSGRDVLPLPRTRSSSAGVGRLQHQLDVSRAGVHVVAFVPVAGPVPPADERGNPTGQRIVNLLRADASGYASRFPRP